MGSISFANAMHNSRKAGRWLSGTNVASFSKSLAFNGFNQKIQTDSFGRGLTNYVILDSDRNRGVNSIRPTWLT